MASKRDYELMMILHPDLDPAGVNAALDQLKARLGQVGEVTACDILGQRRLSYEVRGVRQGIYTLTNFNAPPEEIAGLKQFVQIQLHDQVIRYLLVIDEKRGTRPPSQSLPEDGVPSAEDIEPEAGDDALEEEPDAGDESPLEADEPESSDDEASAEDE